MMINVLVEQNKHWQAEVYQSVSRDKLQKLIGYLPLKQIITITGVRRCGKSTLVKQAINYLIEEGVNSGNILFVNLEHPFFLEYRHDANFLNTIYDEYLKLMNPKGKVYCIFDEVQYFDNWQVYVKSKYESSLIKFIITGSNSSMLSNDLNTLLSGRSLNIHLDTFSFSEFLDYKKIEYKGEFNQTANKIDISRAKDEYLKWGGFFEVFQIEDELIKKELLTSYAKNIIYQDIVPRYNIRNSEVVERLYFYLLTTASGILNYTTLAKIFEVSDRTIKEYIQYFEEVYLLKRIDKFHNKPKEKIKSFKKVYSLDNGFLQLPSKHSSDLGLALENMVFNVLNQRSESVTYLKEIHEVDFYSDDTLYQVTYDMRDERTKEREVNAFNYFKFKHNVKKKVITYDSEMNLAEIECIKLERFILEGL